MRRNNWLKAETSRMISTMLVTALETCREGDVGLAEKLGLSVEVMRQLDKLKPDQIANISGNYMRDITALEILQVDAGKLARFVKAAAEETMMNEMIDEYLLHGACKTMMGELFGLRSTQVANRKKFLNIPTVKGRLRVSTLDQQKFIYDAWLASIKVTDLRERYLIVAKETGLSLSRIFREVKEIESIQNSTIRKNICA